MWLGIKISRNSSSHDARRRLTKNYNCSRKRSPWLIVRHCIQWKIFHFRIFFCSAHISEDIGQKPNWGFKCGPKNFASKWERGTFNMLFLVPNIALFAKYGCNPQKLSKMFLAAFHPHPTIKNWNSLAPWPQSRQWRPRLYQAIYDIIF